MIYDNVSICLFFFFPVFHLFFVLNIICKENSLRVYCIPIEPASAPATFWRIKAQKSYLKWHPFAARIHT